MLEDEDSNRQPQRRRYDEPLFVQVRRQLLTIAESVGCYCGPLERVTHTGALQLVANEFYLIFRLREGWKMIF